MPKPTQHPAPQTPPANTISPRFLGVLAMLAACAVLGPLVATDAPASGSVLTYKLAISASVIGSYFDLGSALMVSMAAHSMGQLIRRPLMRRGVTLPWGVATAMGLGSLLTLIHALWWLAGFLGGLHASAKWIALLGILMLMLAPYVLDYLDFRRAAKRRALTGEASQPFISSPPRTLVPLAIIAAFAFVLPYATVPPGILWPSEYGGYDALSYHLPLAQEWYRQGFIEPNAHNVYSFLPSYFESAFVHLAAMSGGAQAAPAGADGPHQIAVGMLAKNGQAALEAQALSALALATAAWTVAGLVRVLAERIGLGEPSHTSDPRLNRAIDIACMIAAALVMTTPWMVVVSTLAYNEAPMVAMLAAALSCALGRHLGPRARGLLCGVLTGFACCIKPSALVLGAPMVGIAMLVGCWDSACAAGAALAGRARVRTLAICVAFCLLAGAITISPWMIRNAVVAGNPVFPFAASVLGHGHWSKEQAARYGAAHKPDRGVVAALALLVAPDPRVAGDAPAVQRYRGATNPQWMPLAPIGVIGVVALLATRASRRTGLVLLAGSAAVALAWAATTHAQSRFLVVLVPIAAGAAGAAIAQVLVRLSAARVARAGAAIAAMLMAITGAIWLTIGPAAQAARTGALAASLAGPDSLSAVGLSHAVDEVKSDRQQVQGLLDAADPVRFVPLVPGIDLDRVLLIGDATPLYFGPVAYRTTWDTWPILTQMEQHPDRPEDWTHGLHRAGYDLAVVNLSEISRLANSGYLDPRLTPDRIAEWMRGNTRLVRAWNDRGIYLIDLREAPSGGRP